MSKTSLHKGNKPTLSILQFCKNSCWSNRTKDLSTINLSQRSTAQAILPGREWLPLANFSCSYLVKTGVLKKQKAEEERLRYGTTSINESFQKTGESNHIWNTSRMFQNLVATKIRSQTLNPITCAGNCLLEHMTILPKAWAIQRCTTGHRVKAVLDHIYRDRKGLTSSQEEVYIIMTRVAITRKVDT